MENKSNWFVRILIIAFWLFLGTMVSYRFWCAEPVAQISPGIVILIAFMLVLALSELFDNFSIGKLISLSRHLKEKEAQATELKKENSELRNQLITISTSVSQRQSSTTVVGLNDEVTKFLTVRKAEETEIQAKKREEESPPMADRNQRPLRVVDHTKVENMAVEKYIAVSDLQKFSLIRQAKLESQFSGIDPVSNTTPIFDGYVNTNDSEVFIEVKLTGLGFMFSFRERLYLMLTKLHHYKSLKKTNIYLVLILVKWPTEDQIRRLDQMDRILKDFEPAITSGLLRTFAIDVPPEEADSLYRNI